MLAHNQLSSAKQALLEKYLRGEQPVVQPDVNTIHRHTVMGPIPLSFGQQQIWLHTQLVPDLPLYNEPITVRLPGPLDIKALKQSLNAFIQRHEAWRTTFPLIDGQPVQVVHSTFELDVSVVDLCTLPQAERGAEAIRLAQEQVAQLFDLAQLPLLRATLIQLDENDYRLYMTLHHIIFDGYIYEIFLPELRTLYEASLYNTPSPLPALPIQYTDFCIWQHEQQQSQDFATQLAYWKKQLAGVPEALELPADHSRPPVQSYRGSKEVFTLSTDFVSALKDLSLREGVTFYMLLVAAFKVLLYRYTGQSDILIGTTTAGRDYRETHALMGLFLNTLALRTDLSGNPTFHELLGRVRDVVLEAHAHRMIPFEYVIKETQPARNLTHRPLIQILFSLEPPLPVLPSGWTITLTDVEVPISKFDLYFNLDDRPDGFEAWIEYNTDLFDAPTIKRMIGHWQTLLEQVVIDPAQPILSLPLLTSVERSQLLYEWNATQQDYLRDCCLHQLFEEQVAQSPDAIAVICADTQLTYRELNTRANQLAHYLQRQGVGPDVLVGISMQRSLDMMVALLGILKSGGAYVPLDPAYPQERLSYMLEDSQVHLLLTQRAFANRLSPQGHPPVICLDIHWDLIAQESEENVKSAVTSRNLAYMLYTSGSTGRPKGVLGTHRATINRFYWMWHTYPFDSQEVCCQKTTLNFVDSVWEIFGPLLQGIRIVIIPDMVVKDPQDMLQVLSAYSVTRIVLVPSLLRLLLDTRDDLQDRLPDLKYCISSGEALPLELVRRFTNSMPQSVLINLYGSSEVAGDVTYYDTKDRKLLTYVPIGRPIANTQIYLLDRHMQLVPIGVPGELHVGGDSLARGYFNRPELTAEHFIRNPFSNISGDRLYKTGDWARYRSDGTIELIGRLDHQVKIRGFRIEPGEIETMLSYHPAVLRAVAVVREDTPGDKRLVVYVVPKHQQKPSVSDLRSYLKGKLPEYMLPSDFVLLASIPLTPNGKIDRRALPAPGLTRSSTETTYVAPASMVHYQLVQIWEDLLNVRPIGIQDNFFHLGGHSLLAANLINRIEQVFGKHVPLATLFARPTIEQLTDVLLGQEDSGSSSPLVAVQVHGTRRPFFFLHGDYMGGPFYCFALARTLGADQPFYALEPYRFDDLQVLPTLGDIVKAHIEVLRTVQPHGPYLLGGFCNGGLEAYEIARQLQTQGEQVDLLVLVDPAYPPLLHKLARSFINCVAKLMRVSQKRQLEWYLRLRHVYKYMRHERQLEDFKEFNAIDPSIQTLIPTADALRQDNIAVFEWLLTDYRYNTYPGKVTLLWGSEEPFRGIWQRKVAYERNIDMKIIPGTHESCRTDHVQDLADQMRTSLMKVQMFEAKEQSKEC